MDEEGTWLIQAQAGDREAYAALQERLAGDVRRFVLRLIPDPWAADDIVQETFIRFYKRLNSIDPYRLRAYVFRIARNRCYDLLRLREADASLDDEAVEVRVSFTQGHQHPKPDDALHWSLLHLEVREAMDRLPELQRQTLLLFAEQSLSLAEIAEVMGAPIGTVKSRLHYAKHSLRGLLRPAILAVLDEEFAPAPRAKAPRPALDSQSDVIGEQHHERQTQKRLGL